MDQFKKMNIIGGWLVFAIALITYLMTMEPTASLWDCSEFIATSYKLEVGHPPGTPLFFLINRFGAIFAPEPQSVAMMINALSALESALTIAFLFWSISHLARRIYRRDEKSMTPAQNWAVIGAAAIGSLAYTFTDTFWFSAVEAEVYALSSLFTAVVFWAILKWENIADQPGSNRWLVLISYLMGLSIGAHILNLLAIPALVFIYYFKKYPARPQKDLWKPSIIAVLLLGAFYIITPTVVSIGAWVDRIFVNTLGLGINSGLATFLIAIVAALGYGIYRSHQAGRAVMNTILLSTLMVVIGFSTYGVVLIRASVNPPMNSNNPSNPYALISFLNREQYGSNPLVYGQSYASPMVDNKTVDTYYIGEDGKYKPLENMVGYSYDPATKTIFPRMWSTQPQHAREYKNWGQVTGRKVRTSDGQMATVPTFGENLRYFFSYQLNFMYWRYFLWNFVGRQSDIQSHGGITNGNWMSGIAPLDELYLGPQDNLPTEMANNKGRNHYYFLPFILGLVGLFFQLKRDGRNFLIVFLLFFMTGLAIILYLNQHPLQPRERDYAYAGSFYAFAIWIGLGLLPLYEFLGRWIKNHKAAAAAATLICCSVPTILAVQNWDDHDRSGRTLARDMGVNYLGATLPNSIIINYGDNDTFPLWYAQEVESVRPDVRIMNGSYISGDWYIDQMRVRSNESDAVPFTLKRNRYTGDAARSFPIQEVAKPDGSVWTAKEVMEIVNSEDKRSKVFDRSGRGYDFIPAKHIALPVDKESVLASGIVRPEDAHLIEDTLYINLKQNGGLRIDEMMMFDLLANFDWKRPLYFTSIAQLLDFGLVEYNDKEAWSYLQQDGAGYRFVPIRSKIDQNFSVGRIDTEYLYDNLMNKFSYGNLSNPNRYIDSFIENTVGAVQFRSSFARLADQLLAQGDTTRAIKVLDRVMTEFPVNQFRYDDMIVPIFEAYWKAGEDAKGDALADGYINNALEYMTYFDRFKGSKAELVKNDSFEHLRGIYQVYLAAERNGKQAYVEELEGFVK